MCYFCSSVVRLLKILVNILPATPKISNPPMVDKIALCRHKISKVMRDDELPPIKKVKLNPAKLTTGKK